MVYLFIMLKDGDLIFLYRDPNRNYLIKITPRKFHTDKGFIDLEQVRGRSYGESVTTNLGERFFLLKPSLYELMMKVNRQTQIVYPKDAGLIIAKSTVFPGAVVIESGCGSGSLTTAFANFVRPEGKVYTYEKEERFMENARKNVEKNGLSQYVEFKNKLVTDSFDQTEADFVMIDIGSPWELFDAAYKVLKPGHKLATICPTFEQLTRTVFTLEEKNFTNIETIEVLTRRILVRRGKTRPEQKMPSHTGFLVFASKTI